MRGVAEGYEPAPDDGDARAGPTRVAYVMSRFPKLTETFVLNEMIAVERQGVEIHLYPLLRERAPRMHPEAVAWVARAHYLPFLSPAIAWSQVRWLARSPRRYLGALAAMIGGTRRSANLFLGGLGIFPKVAHAARLMERAGVGHVHCHFATHPALAGFIVHRLTGIPYSFTGHGSDLHVRRQMLCEKVREARFVLTVSEDNRRLIERTCGGGHIAHLEVLRCGTDTALFSPGDGHASGADAPFTAIAVGTLHEVKGQIHLIEAAALLRDRGTHIRVRLVGDGRDRQMLEARVRALGIADRVEFLGNRERAEVAELLRASDALVVPSVPTREGKREGLPVVIAEGMSSGLPVVASGISGIPELVVDGETGLTTPPGDASAIAAALQRLVDDPGLRRRFAAAGRRRVLDEYDMDRNAARLVSWFREGVAA